MVAKEASKFSRHLRCIEPSTVNLRGHDKRRALRSRAKQTLGYREGVDQAGTSSAYVQRATGFTHQQS
jgi:hypothetical protein